MNASRALLAALLYAVIVTVVTTNIVPASVAAFDVPGRGSEPEAIRTTIIPTSRMLIAMIVAFIAGWWGASGLSKRWLQQGLLIGALVVLGGLALAAAGGRISARTGTLLLDAGAVLGGAAVASTHVRIRRALLAAAMQVIARVIFVIVVFSIFGLSVTATRGTFGEREAALFQSYAPWVAVAVGIGTAFLAGWWGARGLRDEAVRQGLLIGALILVFSILWITVLGGAVASASVLLNSLNVGAAILGAMFAQRRNRAQPV